MVRLCNLSDIDALFTDQMPEPDISRMLSEADVSLHVANSR
jgi:DeoR/GlpR family transcriptional regulator of sugar metabolism